MSDTPSAAVLSPMPTPGDLEALIAPIAADDLFLEQLEERHREPLRAVCPADDPVWPVYPVRLAGDDFDPAFDAILGDADRFPFAILAGGALAGMSGYLHLDLASRVVEIGGTYMTPAVRGTGLNGRIKPLLIGRAVAAGFARIEFRVDARNARSIRAVEKLGAVREGVLRRQRVTWTGYTRDTVVFSILGSEWRA
jgi:RimJ/RimL family protein N-acetyltransferase